MADMPIDESQPRTGAHSVNAQELRPSDAATGAHSIVEREEGQAQPVEKQAQADAESVGTRAGLMSLCVMLSRITGFVRTWAMAFALGSGALASSYQVANNLPNMLYELVMAGMLVTAFLPVYISVKRKQGQQASNEYASNLLTLVCIILGAVSLIGMLFPQAIVYTQSFYSDQGSMATAVLLFQFFAIQTVFYGGSSIVSGLLNANREYFWSSFAPVFNNLAVIITFVAYAFLAPTMPTTALNIIAIGNPFGVVLQMLVQIPALKRCGVKLRPRVDLKDPAIRETLSIGVPAMFIMLCSFITVSVMNAASYCFADNGPSIIAYSRLWYTLPYSLIAIPITTALFTELSHMREDGDERGFVRTVVDGTCQILFQLIPFMLYLIVFAGPLVTLYHIGAFTEEGIAQISTFLGALALALPFYGVYAYLQKAFSSLRKMGVFAIITFIASVVQVVLTAMAAGTILRGVQIPIETIAWASAVFYLVLDAGSFVYLKRRFGHIGMMRIVRAIVLGLVLGGLGALAGWGVLWGLETFFAPVAGDVPRAFAHIVAGGLVSLAVTFGIAFALKLDEASFVLGLFRKIGRKLRRR